MSSKDVSSIDELSGEKESLNSIKKRRKSVNNDSYSPIQNKNLHHCTLLIPHKTRPNAEADLSILNEQRRYDA